MVAASLLGVGASAPGCKTSGQVGEVTDPPVLSRGERREIDLAYLRFDVTNFEQTLTRKDILALPDGVKERLWLLDLDLSNGPNSPRLLDNALDQIRRLDPATLTPAAQNLQKLLLMTPETADLTGTSLEQLIALSPLLGIAPRDVLAGLLGVNVEDTFLKSDVIAQAILDGVIRTHPNAQRRPGPVDAAHPDGLYAVAPGTLPITLADAVSDFATLADRFGPYDKNGLVHPGFIAGTTRAKVLSDDFSMTVRANANALPYKGLDLTRCEEASVNSVPSQIRGLFDFDDPNWLRINGLVEGTPKIDELTFRAVENPLFIPGGGTKIPVGQGSSNAWQLPGWQLERVLVGAARDAFASQSSSLSFYQPGKPDPLVQAKVDQGWMTIDVLANIGSPPAPAYLWDVLLEVAQVRLHDGGLKEGEATVEVTLRDIPVGTDITAIQDTIKANLQADPSSLLEVATHLIDSTSGEADFYYVRPSPSQPVAQQGDWLFFVTEGDIARDDKGQPTRSYDYASPGFFSDESLTTKVSTTELVDGDTDHEKVRVNDGDRVFVGGKKGQVFRLDVGKKPSVARCHLTVTRVK